MVHLMSVPALHLSNKPLFARGVTELKLPAHFYLMQIACVRNLFVLEAERRFCGPWRV